MSLVGETETVELVSRQSQNGFVILNGEIEDTIDATVVVDATKLVS